MLVGRFGGDVFDEMTSLLIGLPSIYFRVRSGKKTIYDESVRLYKLERDTLLYIQLWRFFYTLREWHTIEFQPRDQTDRSLRWIWRLGLWNDHTTVMMNCWSYLKKKMAQ